MASESASFTSPPPVVDVVICSSASPSCAVTESAVKMLLLQEESAAVTPRLPFFERYLSAWVAICMVGGALIGFYAPASAEALASAQIHGINAIIAALLWVMLFPMFLTLDFASVRTVRKAPAAILITCVLSYCVKPFTMWGLGLLFVRVFYSHVIPDDDLRNSYIAGMVLLAGAPCTAMVFVWSQLMGGNTAYTLAQVAANDLLMLLLYVPICGLLIGATNFRLPWDTIAVSVSLFIVAPLALATGVRYIVLNLKDEKFLLERIVAPIKPLTTIALLATLVLIFIFQGATLGTKTADIFLVAVPITIQCVLLWCIAYYACWYLKIPHERTAPASLIATSNFFELAVAVAVSIYGPSSGAALATVVGVLVEVPVMLAFVHLCMYLKPMLDKRCAEVGSEKGLEQMLDAKTKEVVTVAQ